MGKPLFICPRGHYSILNPTLVTVSPDGIAIRCTVCQEVTLISLHGTSPENPPCMRGNDG
jgi:hypothetical protein